MRIYSGLSEAHKEIMRDLLEVGEWIHGHSVQDQTVEGDESFDFMELSPYTYMITQTDDLKNFTKELGLNRSWIDDEFEERLIGGLNPGVAWTKREATWRPFIEHTGRFAYTYSERLHRNNQLNRVISELRLHPASRQAVVTMYQVDADVSSLGGFRRIPCSMFYQLMVRRGALDLHYVMRSCDFFQHFPYDQILAIKLQAHVAERLNRPVGIFTHFITSLHGFRRNFPRDVF